MSISEMFSPPKTFLWADYLARIFGDQTKALNKIALVYENQNIVQQFRLACLPFTWPVVSGRHPSVSISLLWSEETKACITPPLSPPQSCTSCVANKTYLGSLQSINCHSCCCCWCYCYCCCWSQDCITHQFSAILTLLVENKINLTMHWGMSLHKSHCEN